MEEVSKEEGSKRDRIDRKSETAEEMIEELRRRLAHEAMGPPPVCRVRTLIPSSLAPAGSIMAVHRLSKVKPVGMVVTLDGKEWSLQPRRDGLPTVEILD